MPKFQVDTLSGTFLFDARDEDQARRLGQDGGRIVVKIEQLDDDSDDASDDAPDEASDFGDEEIVVVKRSDYDRLTAYARAGGMDDDIADVDGADRPHGGVTVDDTPGIVAPDATTVTAPSFEPGQASDGDDVPAVEFRRADDAEDRDDGDATPAE